MIQISGKAIRIRKYKYKYKYNTQIQIPISGKATRMRRRMRRVNCPTSRNCLHTKINISCHNWFLSQSETLFIKQGKPKSLSMEKNYKYQVEIGLEATSAKKCLGVLTLNLHRTYAQTLSSKVWFLLRFYFVFGNQQ